MTSPVNPSSIWDTQIALPIAFLSVALLFVIQKYQQAPAKRPYPPGPKPKPLLGNAFDLPLDKGWETYLRWSKEYNSDIVSATALGQPIIALNSRECAIELLEKRGRIYSSRHVIPMIELFGWHEFNIVTQPYGPLWRRHRRVFQQSFRQEASINYQPAQIQKVRDALSSILHTPNEFLGHLQTLSGAIIMSVVYDYDVSPTNDHFLDVVNRALEIATSAVLPGTHLVNTIPILRHLPAWFPGANFHRVAVYCRRLTHEIQKAPYEMVRKKMAEGNTRSVLSKLLRQNDARGGSKEDERVISDAMTIAYAAGNETTISTFEWFVLAMALNPDIQRKGQREILQLIGNSRLPTFEDRPALPYIEAIYREMLRWKPVLPLGVPHKSTEDDHYNGYFVPKGSIVLSNIWAMTRNEVDYPEPEKFKPGRFIDEHGNLTDDDRVLAYGFGKRICPGKYFASSSVWLFIACFLTTFDVTKAKDDEGNEVDIPVDGTGGFVSHPLPFKCSITPRSEAAKRLIESTD
ncbi:cytochrome P450 [Pluteus cervinus]|uniref:Cytochrome P450 n=1 Tax=Pluteus cervinus TaxID=181527 RepID=A0ACD3AIU2_9AGAR|nr:cytochrome P450 [Pluteus cervinus]